MKTLQLIMPQIKNMSQEKIFLLTIMIVNGGNYLYNLLLGRYLGPEAFADAALLITFLLVLSFIGMTFQIVTTKFAAELSDTKFNAFTKWITKKALAAGIVTGALVMCLSTYLQELFHTQSWVMFVVFGAGLPFYFLMSINRGIYQGNENLTRLSATYQTEMISRLAFTLILLVFFSFINSSVAIATGILASVLFGLLPFQKKVFKQKATQTLEKPVVKRVLLFFAITAFYELTQIIINNSDILLVKHYFDNTQAGLYASLALIGRVVYFVAWMFVMMMLPKAIKLKKEGANTTPLLLKNVMAIAALSTIIVLTTYMFPELAVNILFGQEYLGIATLLWQYALATSIFAISNIFAYYFLSTGKYIPVILSAIMGLSQIALIVFFHNSLNQVVYMQIVAMSVLLLLQLSFFFYHTLTNIRLH
jgi:O-antigen/teichoic acid export membrane protein